MNLTIHTSFMIDFTCSYNLSIYDKRSLKWKKNHLPGISNENKADENHFNIIIFLLKIHKIQLNSGHLTTHIPNVLFN